MWELDHKEGWAPKNWCFWTMMLEKTLKSPLDCKKIKPVNPKGDQPWIFNNNAAAAAALLYITVQQTNSKSMWLRNSTKKIAGPEVRKQQLKEAKIVQFLKLQLIYVIVFQVYSKMIQLYKPVNLKGNNSWIFIGRTDAEAEAPILWLPDAKSQHIAKDPDAGKDHRQEGKGATEDEMIGWQHWLNGHDFEQALGDGEGQGSLVCWHSRRSLSRTQLSDWTRHREHMKKIQQKQPSACINCTQFLMAESLSTKQYIETWKVGADQFMEHVGYSEFGWRLWKGDKVRICWAEKWRKDLKNTRDKMGRT